MLPQPTTLFPRQRVWSPRQVTPRLPWLITLSQAESAISQAGIPQATPVVRHSARLRASQSSSNNSQAGNTPRTDSAISQPDSRASQEASPKANASQEARASPLPNRQNNPKGSSSIEEPHPKWVINVSSKPLTKAQRSVLAKGPNFVVFPKHTPNLEYITVIEAALPSSVSKMLRNLGLM